MKKLLMLLLITTISFGTFEASAQTPYEKGSLDMNFTFGGSTGWGLSPLHFSMNYNIMDFLSIGGEVGYNIDFYWAGWYYYYGVYDNYLFTRHGGSVTARADYHFNSLMNLDPKWDIYAGVQTGIGFFGKFKNKNVEEAYTPTSNSVVLVLGPHAGARWYWSDKMGLNLETGYHWSQGVYAQFGLAIKMK